MRMLFYLFSARPADWQSLILIYFLTWELKKEKTKNRYGGTAPVVPGSLVLDLHRLNRIIEVNEEYAYAIVEPGVSFFDLYKHIKTRGLKLWPSVPAIGWGSIVGNTIDRGFGYTPNGEHAQHQCGMEVVLPSGELLRTGMAAMDGSTAFALYKGYAFPLFLFFPQLIRGTCF